MSDHAYHHWFGLGGVPPHDNPSAYRWERRLHPAMIVAALLAIPAFYLEEVAGSPVSRGMGWGIEAFVFLAFGAELLWMLRLTHHKVRYLVINWLSLFIVLSAGLSLAGWGTEWVPLIRLIRLALVAMLLARMLGALRNLFSPEGLPYLFAFALVLLLVAGAGFYWLEPTVGSYAEGVWLAFTSGTTVGYGDIVPTAAASRLFAVFMVLLGYALMSVVTAVIVSFFIGEDEKRLRREMHRDIKQLRDEVARLREELRQREGSGAEGAGQGKENAPPAAKEG